LGYRLGIDIGGTFTDFVLIGAGGSLHEAKALSTPDAPARGIDRGLAAVGARLGLSTEELLARTDLIVHGTTVGLNVLLEGEGACAALLCTEGFRDSIETRLAWKEKRYDWQYPPPPTLVPRRLRLPIRERVDKTGAVRIPLSESDVLEAIETMKREKVEAVAVSFLWSFLHPAHERRVGEILRAKMPSAYVSLSVDVLPQIREYDRASTTTVNAYVGPVMRAYVENIEAFFRDRGYGGAVRYIQSNSGLASGDEIRRRPVSALGSGPAAGPSAGLWHAEETGEHDILTVDMGGTSCDVCLVKNGRPTLVKGVDFHRYRLGVPLIDVNAIGAGGGSIAWVDRAGMLHVGPASAGAEPGPACYGRGGTSPTVTDADVVLGHLDRAKTLGAEISLRSELAEDAVRRLVARPLGLGVDRAALAVFEIVNHNMARAIGEVSVERGLDPRDFALIVAGGCGPIHACALADEIGVKRIMIPKVAAEFCAFGEVVADVRHMLTRSLTARVDTIKAGVLDEIFEALETEGRSALESEGIGPSQMRMVNQVDMRYVGQIYECTVDIGQSDDTGIDLDGLVQEFHRVHHDRFGYSEEDNLCELISASVTAIGQLPHEAIEAPARNRAGEVTLTGGAESYVHTAASSRSVLFPGEDARRAVPVHNGRSLSREMQIQGPAIIEEPATTVVVFPAYRLTVGGRSYVLEKIGDSLTQES
jgi:N-methylhydantoinase A